MRCALALLALLVPFCPSSPAATALARPSAASAAVTGHDNRQLTLAPAPGDISLLSIRFPRSGRRRLGGGALRARAIEPYGDDYLALVALRAPGHHGDRALAVLVNRPSPLLDPSSVRVRLTSLKQLGPLTILRFGNPFAMPAQTTRPALCDLPLGGHPLDASDLTALSSQGSPMAGLGPAEAAAEAYDDACGLAAAGTLRSDLECGSDSGPTSADCCSSSGSCAPAPAPVPVPAPPGCQPCDYQPGHACPLVAKSAVCVAGAAAAGRRASASAH